jgi:hypothetical protein
LFGLAEMSGTHLQDAVEAKLAVNQATVCRLILQLPGQAAWTACSAS